MTGVKAPAAVLGATAALATHATHATGKHPVAGIVGSTVKGTLPFTGAALGIYFAIGLSLVLAGLLLRIYAHARN